MNEEVRFSIALHEAGHAVAAVVLGIGVVGCSLDVEADECYFEHEEFFPATETDERNAAFAVMSLAGFAAQYLHDPGMDAMAYEDNVEEDLKGVQLCLQASSDDAAEHAMLRMEWSYAARDLVAYYWDAIERVGTALYERKSLTGPDIKDLIGID